MKAQYVGDIGDFGKVLLLKHLSELGFKIGVNWVLTKNDDSDDGKHRDYFTYRGVHCLCRCDANLLDGIAPLARKRKLERMIGDLENLIRGFSKDTVFYSTNFDGDLARNACDDGAFLMLNTDAADLVFFDPDNGIGGERGPSAKHVYHSDLRRYWERGQSLLIYHHLPQRRSAENTIRNLMEQLQGLPKSQVKSYRFRRGTGRVYLLCIQPKHFGRIPDPEDLGKFAPLLASKGEWSQWTRIKQKSCPEDHPWYKPS